MLLKKLALYFTRVYQFKRISNKLLPGVYWTDRHFKCFYLDNDESRDYTSRFLRISNTDKPAFLPRFRVKHSKGKSCIALFSNSIVDNGKPSSIKLFNLKDGEITTVYNDLKKMEADLSIDATIVQHFGITRPLQIGHDILKEKLISYTPVIEWSESDRIMVLRQIIQKYVKLLRDYPSDIKMRQIYIDDEVFKREFKKEIGVSCTPNVMVPIVYQHGDLSVYNVLYKKDINDVTFIDFEHFSELYFLYDIFWMIEHSLIYENNKTLLKAFIDGKFDDDLSNLFKSVGQSYEPEKKFEYLTIFIVEFYKERVERLDSNNKQIAINNLHHFISCIREEMENDK